MFPDIADNPKVFMIRSSLFWVVNTTLCSDYPGLRDHTVVEAGTKGAAFDHLH